MIDQVINAFKDASLKHKAVWTFKYQDKINLQPNNKHYSVSIETDGLFSSSAYGLVLTLNMNVLGFVEVNEQTTQDIASQIGLSIINRVIKENRNILSLKDYSILLFTKRTDDVCSGARFTIQISVPEFIDYCIEDDYFLTDEEYEEKLISLSDSELDLGEQIVSNQLDLKPLKL